MPAGPGPLPLAGEASPLVLGFSDGAIPSIVDAVGPSGAAITGGLFVELVAEL